jgi:hypothetical protein
MLRITCWRLISQLIRFGKSSALLRIILTSARVRRSLCEPYVITTQVLAYDDKRIHQFMRMYHAEKHYLAATAEWLNLHVDLSIRRVAPWPDDIRDEIAAFTGGQDDGDWPAEAGKQMSLAKPIYSVVKP